MIIAVFGLPGSGKSYFARKLAASLHAAYLGSDEIRKQMFPKPTYSTAEKRQVYKALYEKMYDFLHRKQHLVLDATFYRREIRSEFDMAAETIGCKIIWIEIRSSDETISRRLSVKRPDSDADLTVHKKIKNQFEGMRRPHLILQSTNSNLEEMITATNDYLKRIQKESGKTYVST